ncbi:MAG: hypothetical protein E6Q44_05010 [Flavobacteriales bacterium]|nr:MAG: hypothetical protein E6Q44_05010 [Flavobacteriales bacterium]
MLIVPRRVHRISDNHNQSTADSKNQPLSDFRTHSAWVLLGEPGAGKTSAFAEEATATGGLHLSIAEFLLDGLQEELRERTLFLDGLDETRASGAGESILLQVRARLKQLGSPPFRIACRAADWFGSSDEAAIKSASPDGELAMLVLEALGDDDIAAILRENHGIADPDSFIKKAESHDVAELLRNPQTLGLLAEAIRGENWPSSRQKTFELACEKLAGEWSKAHRTALRQTPQPPEKLLDVAGQLCAAMLLADKSGIALDRDSADARFPVLDDFSPPDHAEAVAAARRALFRPEAAEVERVVPAHRSVAEFLAARWLAHRIDRGGLPVGRVLNLLQGQDGRTVAGLRGLYAWLALYCLSARPALIAADPLTVILYGDAKPMSPNDKRSLLAGLRQEARRFTGFHWDARRGDALGALADAELIDEFREALASPDRDDATQSYATCLLAALGAGPILPELGSLLKAIACDDSRWGHVRTTALEAWLRLSPPTAEAIDLLDDFADGRVADGDDELAGRLLQHLYPAAIEPGALTRYLHVPKNTSLIGNYSWFWRHEVAKNAPPSHLPSLLDALATRNDLTASEQHEYFIDGVLNGLLARGVTLHGDQVGDERLFSWLGIGVDKFGHSEGDQEDRRSIARWLEEHPERHKRLLGLCYRACEGAEQARARLYTFENRFRGAAAPADIGLWHLQQVAQTPSDELAEEHLAKAVFALIREQGNVGLTLEHVEAWGEAHPEKRHWLAPLLACEIRDDDWRLEDAARKNRYKQERAERIRERTVNLRPRIDAIRAGTANVALMHELAGVWLNLYSDVHGATVAERFDNYCANSAEIRSAAEAGFRRCPLREDLPAVADIIDLATKQREHFIRQPCLLGMELRWQDGAESIDMLADDILRRMLAFRLTYGADNTPTWFSHLARVRPPLVSEVLVTYASAILKSKSDFIDGIYPLAHDAAYAEVAALAAPQLLDRFPLRARSGQLNHLEYLLKAALKYARDALMLLVEKKTAMTSLDAPQKVYWLAAGMLLAPECYESALWQFIGKSSTRANYLSGFLSERFGEFDGSYLLSVASIGKLIELLAPHAELDWSRSGMVSEAMRRGDHVRALVTRLGAIGTPESAEEIERLLASPGLQKLKFALESTRHQLQLHRREKDFRFPELAEVAQVLANREPASPADLLALTLAHLDDIARDVRQDNADLFGLFWTETEPNTPKTENSCRDALLPLLRARLSPFGIDCQPEGDYFNDKRADIRVSFRNTLDLPIEIKGEWNESLWTGLRKQLIGQYAIAPKAAEHGIYLVLWFGGDRQKAGTLDGGKRPRSASELQERLTVLLDPAEQKRIFVRVLDLRWPTRSRT